jgi:hypothetical protein
LFEGLAIGCPVHPEIRFVESATEPDALASRKCPKIQLLEITRMTAMGPKNASFRKYGASQTILSANVGLTRASLAA